MNTKDPAGGTDPPPKGRVDAAHWQRDNRQNQGTGRRPPQDGDVKDQRARLPNLGNLLHTGVDHENRRSDETNMGRQQHWDNAKDVVDRCPEPGRPQRHPAIERYLREGDRIGAYQRQEREGYPQGSPGMRQYLGDWQRTWNGASNKDAG